MNTNKDIFQTNSSIDNTDSRNKHNLSYFQKSIFYAGIKIFNGLPPSVTIHKNDKTKFKAAVGIIV
jgi:hypothetical protein